MAFYELIEIPNTTPISNNLYKDGFRVLCEESYGVVMEWLVENIADDDAYQEQFVDESRSSIVTGAVVKASWTKYRR